VDALGAIITFAVGLGGVTLGAMLSRRNERRARSEGLLVEALNDAVDAIAAVAGGDAGAQRRYASAVSRVALHAPPEMVTVLRRFQDDATTHSPDGRRRLLAVLQEARSQLGHAMASDEDVAVLLFGPVTERPGSDAQPSGGTIP
jgi:hypothetical protein